MHVYASTHLAFLIVFIGCESQEAIAKLNQTAWYKDILDVGVGFHPPRRMGFRADSTECGLGKTSGS